MKPHSEWATPTTAADNNTTIPLFWIRPSHLSDLTWHWEEQKQSTSTPFIISLSSLISHLSSDPSSA